MITLFSHNAKYSSNKQIYCLDKISNKYKIKKNQIPLIYIWKIIFKLLNLKIELKKYF